MGKYCAITTGLVYKSLSRHSYQEFITCFRRYPWDIFHYDVSTEPRHVSVMFCWLPLRHISDTGELLSSIPTLVILLTASWSCRFWTATSLVWTCDGLVTKQVSYKRPYGHPFCNTSCTNSTLIRTTNVTEILCTINSD